MSIIDGRSADLKVILASNYNHQTDCHINDQPEYYTLRTSKKCKMQQYTKELQQYTNSVVWSVSNFVSEQEPYEDMAWNNLALLITRIHQKVK